MKLAQARPLARLALSAVSVGALAVAAACGATGANEPEVAFTVPGSPTTTIGSAKDKPCVAPVDVPTAEGKPVVDMPIGPPPTELVKIDITEGTGAEVKLNDTIKVQYVGIACSTGKQFDSSWDRGEPAEFQLAVGALIAGWTDGIPGMKVGGRRQLNIPSSLGYKEQGSPPDIAPDEALVFVIDIVEIVPATAGGTPGSTETVPGAEAGSTSSTGADAGSTSTTAADAGSTTSTSTAP